jgi:hypothetical protein
VLEQRTIDLVVVSAPGLDNPADCPSRGVEVDVGRLSALLQRWKQHESGVSETFLDGKRPEYKRIARRCSRHGARDSFNVSSVLTSASAARTASVTFELFRSTSRNDRQRRSVEASSGAHLSALKRRLRGHRSDSGPARSSAQSSPGIACSPFPVSGRVSRISAAAVGLGILAPKTFNVKFATA